MNETNKLKLKCVTCEENPILQFPYYGITMTGKMFYGKFTLLSSQFCQTLKVLILDAIACLFPEDNGLRRTSQRGTAFSILKILLGTLPDRSEPLYSVDDGRFQSGRSLTKYLKRTMDRDRYLTFFGLPLTRRKLMRSNMSGRNRLGSMFYYKEEEDRPTIATTITTTTTTTTTITTGYY
ncbi:hypothetical protein V1477_009405 [Vespula maculifrons]|uniref:Uncharacterized protein n=1 Tax=Vespula maculifrons TaxID=7453 RepID=A0ABD2C9P0_VESMC